MDVPDVIVVLAGGIKSVNGHWASTDLTKEDSKLGAPGASLRAVAAAVLSNQYPSARVIASGGKGFDVPKEYPEERPLLCDIIEEELIVAGVPRERIDREGESNTTYQQLQQLEILRKEHAWKHLLIVSSRWHLPRTKAMLEKKFHHLRPYTEFVSAEDILIASDSVRWEQRVVDAYASQWMAERIAREKSGVEQIKNGSYRFR